MSTALSLPLSIQSVGSLTQLIRAAHDAPYLSAEEEHALAVRLQDGGDLDAARQLVSSHLRYVIHVARGYNGYGLPQADLIQEGAIGLMKAVRRFDPRRGIRLVSFAVHWIRAEIHEYVLRNWSIVKIATTKAQRKLFFNLRGSKKRLGWLNNEEAAAVAADLGVEIKQVREMEQRLSARDAAFDLSVDEDEDSAYLVPAQYLEDHSGDPARQLEQADWEEVHYGRLNAAVATLDERSRDIIQQRWLSDEKVTLHDLAAKYAVSAERIRQLEQSAMNKVRGLIEPQT